MNAADLHAIALVLWFLTGLSVLAALGEWAIACRALGRLREWHHVWIGVGLACVPPLPGWWLALSLTCWALAWWIAWDDAHLHHRQAETWTPGDRELTGADDGASFWHRLANRLGAI